MQTPSEMKKNMGGMTPVGKTLDQNMDNPETPLSMALKKRRLEKAAKRRLDMTNAPDDNPNAITNPNPGDE